MIQIVVPMAGLGSRFATAGFELPKPLIDVAGRPMIEVVIENLRPRRPHRFVFVVQREQVDGFGLDSLLGEWAPGCEVVSIDGLTAGAACTVLRARDHLEPELPLMVANCDQWLDADVESYLAHFDGSAVDGFLMTMPADHPKWSYVQLDDRGWVRRVVEKEVVSNMATVGVYNWTRAGDFTVAAEAMIYAERRVNGEFYVAPVYQEMIERGAHVEAFDVDCDGQAMYGLGTPEDLADFVAGDGSKRLQARQALRV